MIGLAVDPGNEGSGDVVDSRDDVAGLLYYLYGPGRANEHRDPHIVAGWRPPEFIEPPQAVDGHHRFDQLIELLTQPVVAAPIGWPGPKKPVWHCVLRAAPEDRRLDDAEWAEAAEEVMHHTGLAPRGDVDAVRWIAVRHAEDHIHIMATLARVDGRRAALHHDHYRIAETCRRLEHRFELRRLGAGDRTAPRRPSRAETEQVCRGKRAVATRIALRRTVMTAAAAAHGQEEFFAHLEAAGIQVQLRRTEAGKVVGYDVALPGHTNAAGDPIRYGGGSLAADLTLPKLRQRWEPPNEPPPAAGQEHQSTTPATGDPANVVDAAATDVRQAVPDPTPHSDDIAWAASDLLHVIADATGPSDLWLAAELYDRAARPPYGRIPPPTSGGNRIRATARLLAVTPPTIVRDLQVLLASIAGLAETVADLRDAQERSVQAIAARRAAEHLRQTISGPWPDTLLLPDRSTRRGDSAWSLVTREFPTEPPVSEPSRPSPAPTPARRPTPAPQRGTRPHDPPAPRR